MHYPIALEGALKLKEISYIHAEAYPAGELKHGPLALVDRDMPVVAIAPTTHCWRSSSPICRKCERAAASCTCSPMPTVTLPESEGVHVMRLTENRGALSPILHVVPLQLLAYHAALVRGTDVDKPRNLAKSVTVE